MKTTKNDAVHSSIPVSTSASETLPTTTTQASDSPRASNAITTYDQAILSKIQELPQLDSLTSFDCTPRLPEQLKGLTHLNCRRTDFYMILTFPDQSFRLWKY